MSNLIEQVLLGVRNDYRIRPHPSPCTQIFLLLWVSCWVLSLCRNLRVERKRRKPWRLEFPTLTLAGPAGILIQSREAETFCGVIQDIQHWFAIGLLSEIFYFGERRRGSRVSAGKKGKPGLSLNGSMGALKALLCPSLWRENKSPTPLQVNNTPTHQKGTE